MKYKIALLLFVIFAGFYAFSVKAQELTPTAVIDNPPTPADVIERVNNLRLANGLNPLAAHPVLMQIAQEQANGIASGFGGHWRPNNLTLGQWLISLGYPLSGDLSQDGYRSENWVMADSAEGAILAWLGDEPHTNTMLSPNRSDMGVGITLSDGSYIIVLETALRTTSGQMQTSAKSFLTGVPLTQQAAFAVETLAAENGTLPQYLLPIVLNTANPSGDVFHEVRYGQTLWSIAISYHTTIKEIQSLNNWNSTDVYVGQLLLVKKSATPPPQVAAVSATQTFILPEASITPALKPTITSIAKPETAIKSNNPGEVTLSLVGIIITALILGSVFAFSRKKVD
jgi:LysM repeat protein